MALEPRDITIIAQNSTSAAAAIVAAEITASGEVGEPASFNPDYFNRVRRAIFDGTIELATGSHATVAQVVQAFPGAEVVQFPQPAPQGGFQPGPAPAPAPSFPQPASSSGHGGVDALWNEFFADPSQWYDNRQGKTNPNGPDFRHKTKTDAKGNKLALWIHGKQPTPQWVLQRLGLG